jgi:signal transduction histidine kinase
MTDKLRESRDRRSNTLEEQHVEALQAYVDQLRLEVAELRAARRRLALAADSDRHGLERELHDGVQQHLVALSVNLQLAEAALADPAAVEKLIAAMTRDVQQAVEETAQLAERIYPPLLEAGGLAVALRSAAASLGIPVSLEVVPSGSYPREVAAAVYWCCLEALEHAGSGARATITVRDDDAALSFEVVVDTEADLVRARDRLEALGGRLAIESEAGGRTRVSGALPLSR